MAANPEVRLLFQMSTNALTRVITVIGVVLVIAIAFVAGLSVPGLINPSHPKFTITEVRVNEQTVVVPILVSGTCTGFGGTMYTVTTNSTSYLLPSKTGYLTITIVTITSNPPQVTSTRILTFPNP